MLVKGHISTGYFDGDNSSYPGQGTCRNVSIQYDRNDYSERVDFTTTSRHYGTEGFKGGHQSSPHYAERRKFRKASIDGDCED